MIARPCPPEVKPQAEPQCRRELQLLEEGAREGEERKGLHFKYTSEFRESLEACMSQLSLRDNQFRASEMAQRLKAPAAKPDNPSLSLDPLRMKGESRDVLWHLHGHHCTPVPTAR